MTMLGKIPWNKGKKWPEWHKKRISLKLRGRVSSRKGKKFGKNKGKRIGRKGEKSNFWKGGITKAHLAVRTSTEYKLWREAIFKRDNYTCIWCGDSRGHNLHADHIKPFSLFPELRLALDNGRTLCKSCHMKTDTWGNKINKWQWNIPKSQNQS